MNVSALLTTYNYAGFVGKAVQSVLDQDYGGPLECIVVDDGSTDDTPSVLARFGDRIRVVRQPNAGQAAAFNSAYEVSSGDILCLLDADDTWKPTKVREVVEAFRASPAVGLVHHDLEIVDGQGRKRPDHRNGLSRPAHGDVSKRMLAEVLPYPFASTSGLSLRRTVAGFVFPLSTNLKTNADALLAPSAALLAPVRWIDEALGVYVLHGGNLWTTDLLRAREGELDERLWAQKFVEDMEERVRHANLTLARAGRPAHLSPWSRWSYVKYRALLEGRSPLAHAGDCLQSLWHQTSLSPLVRASLALKLLRRSIKNHRRLRGATKGVLR